MQPTGDWSPDDDLRIGSSFMQKRCRFQRTLPSSYYNYTLSFESAQVPMD